jgi:hypothetical protein
LIGVGDRIILSGEIQGRLHEFRVLKGGRPLPLLLRPPPEPLYLFRAHATPKESRIGNHLAEGSSRRQPQLVSFQLKGKQPHA